jgi:hypothetical protein
VWEKYTPWQHHQHVFPWLQNIHKKNTAFSIFEPLTLYKHLENYTLGFKSGSFRCNNTLIVICRRCTPSGKQLWFCAVHYLKVIHCIKFINEFLKITFYTRKFTSIWGRPLEMLNYCGWDLWPKMTKLCHKFIYKFSIYNIASTS